MEQALSHTQQHTLRLLQQYNTQQRFYGKSYPKIPFLFTHNARDFIVEELPLYPFSNSGEHRILKIRKKNLSTLQCVGLIAQALQLQIKAIGYAGLKDKNALTYQYISVPNKAFMANQAQVHAIPQIKIIESCLHENKIKIGHLRGNHFIIRLKKVMPQHFERIQEEAFAAQQYGFPNFFGYQRFGNFGDNYMQALQIKKPPNKQSTLQQLLISSLQSVYFNLWLEERLKISSIMHNFNLTDSIKALTSIYNITMDREIIEILHKAALPLTPLIGDVCMHYPHGKFFYFGEKQVASMQPQEITIKQILSHDIKRLHQGDISITGLLSGMGCHQTSHTDNTESKKQKKCHVKLAKDYALHIEEKFCHEIMAHGTRRYAWVYPHDLHIAYHQEHAHVDMSFTLPSGAYATSFLSYIKNGDVRIF